MILQGKVAAVEEQIESRLKNRINTVELQLLDGDTTGSVLNVLTKYPELQVTAVHPVISSDKEYITANLNHLSYPKVLDNFVTACVVADFMGKAQKRKVAVIVHNTMAFHDYECAPVLFNNVVEALKSTQSLYTNIYFLVENVPPFSSDTHMCNGSLADDVGKLVLALRKHNIDVGITLDLCHNTMTKRLFEKLYNESELGTNVEENMKKFTLEYWFRTYGELIKNVHISKCIGFGFSKSHHGAPIDNYDYEELQKLRSLCNLYCEDEHTLWTVEVSDNDYVNPVNQLDTIERLVEDFSLYVGENRI